MARTMTMAGTKAAGSTRGVVATAARGAGQCTKLATGPYASSSSTLSFVVLVP